MVTHSPTQAQSFAALPAQSGPSCAGKPQASMWQLSQKVDLFSVCQRGRPGQRWTDPKTESVGKGCLEKCYGATTIRKSITVLTLNKLTNVSCPCVMRASGGRDRNNLQGLVKVAAGSGSKSTWKPDGSAMPCLCFFFNYVLLSCLWILTVFFPQVFCCMMI